MKSLTRIGLFIITNILVMMVLSAILAFFNIPMDQLWGFLVVCAIFGFGGSFISLFLSKFMVKRAYRVKLIDPANAQGKELFVVETIRNMADHHRIKMPQVGVFPSVSLNAFATGARKNSALVAFSDSLLYNLSEEEIAAVAGHEMTHIIEGDMVTMSLLMGLVNTFVMFLARILAAVLDSALKDDEGKGGLGFIGYRLVVMLLQNVLFLLAYIPVSAYSRHREYRADAGSAKLVGPAAMISALRALEQNVSPPSPKRMATDMAMIHNKRKVSLFATHPTIEDRVQRLQRMM
ncbi:MAG: protease HtpX [Candidatus Cloacimonetes bacterium]|nr:protease HtpX [Candidatus Cloacimonadota bacterium]